MPAIQIDMFEVQLGAAILLQFEADDAVVRVLADAGVKAGGYPVTHVRDKLKAMLSEPTRIDLMIGTHYDEDHLNGLVPIIEDPGFSISEAWMPPVANDTQSFAADQPVASGDLLTTQLAREDGDEVLAVYLAAKRRDIETVGALEAELDPDGVAGIKRVALQKAEFFASEDPLDLRFFRAQLEQDGRADEIDHGCEQEIESSLALTRTLEDVQNGLFRYWYYDRPGQLDGLKEFARDMQSASPELVAPRARTLANLRSQVAKEAVNAGALRKVLAALSRRNIPVRSEVIDDGIPRRYRWTAASQRFVLARPDSAGLTFDLLGPSKSLVKKHRDRLPVLETGRIALAFAGEIRSITASNQLSYIGCFRHAGQGVLVSGDAGCVDFKPDKGAYFPQLLAAMKSLHVVQVAHHAGANAHFYRVLAAAGYPAQVEPSWLLLSHATHDRTRPSDVFHDFLLTNLKDGDDIRLLFTSEPTRDKVVDYLAAINPVVGPPGTVGDIRLQYQDQWGVAAHAISVR